MTPFENLYFALGELAYSIACSDGMIQKEEREKFKEILLKNLNPRYIDISDIIFKILEKERSIDSQISYDWAIKEISINSHYLSPKMKKNFIETMEKIAQAFPPIGNAEFKLLEKFKKDIEPINGDPLLYEKY